VCGAQIGMYGETALYSLAYVPSRRGQAQRCHSEAVARCSIGNIDLRSFEAIGQCCSAKVVTTRTERSVFPERRHLQGSARLDCLAEIRRCGGVGGA
jgi:hypothetical protein